MAYADYGFYRNSYYGDMLDAYVADKWLEMASDEIDTLTFGRLTFAYPTAKIHSTKVQKAVCAMAEALYQIDLQCKATAAQQTADGSYRGAVSSVTSGKESVSFSVNAVAASAYAAAAVNAKERDRLLCSIAGRYLANIPDAQGVNLLYAGGMHDESRHNHPI